VLNSAGLAHGVGLARHPYAPWVVAAPNTQPRLPPNGSGLEAGLPRDLERGGRLAVPRGAASTCNSTASRWLGEELFAAALLAEDADSAVRARVPVLHTRV